jgi:hypothetical protein
MLRRVLHPSARHALLAPLAVLLGCAPPTDSSLERRAAAPAPAGPPITPTTIQPAPAPAPTPRPQATPTPVVDPAPGAGESVTLRFALPDGAHYRITTVGMIQYPMMPKQTGFARQEEILLRECSGEGSDRACLLEHRTTAFEAEPPYGRFIEADEAPVRPLVTRHRISATGERLGDTTVDGPAEALATPAALALTGLHRLYCVRFPSEAIAVGASWTTTCETRIDGRVAARTVRWQLTNIDEDPQGSGKRAELRYEGGFRNLSTEGGVREGTFGGVLYFWVDLGEPHILREGIIADVVAEQGATTRTSINIQFAKVDPLDPTKITQTDGKPLPEPTNAPIEQAAPAAKPLQ